MTEREEEQAVELFRRLQAIGRGQVSLSAQDAWVILAAVQLAWRHPSLGNGLKEHLWSIGHRLTRIFEEDQLVTDLAAMGWQQQLDLPFSGKGENSP